MWRPRTKTGIALGCAAAWVLVGGGARAEVVDATSTTLIAGRQDPRDGVIHTTVPVFELLSLRATDLRLHGVDDMSVVLSGWGEISLAEPLEGHRGLGDLDVAYAEGKVLRRHVRLRLGRQLLVAGAGRNLQFDGVDVTAYLWRGVGASAQAGVPVTPRFAVDRGDAMAGGRLFWRPRFDREAGLSILHVIDDGQVSRQELAADARVVVAPPLALTGFWRYSLYDRRTAEADLAATGQVGSLLQLTADYRRTAPDLFLPRNSIFSVFSQETRDEVGGAFYLRPQRRLRLQGDYHVFMNADGTGQDASGKLTATVGQERRSTAGLEGRRLELPHGGYTLARAFGLSPLAPRLTGTADASAFFFDEALNGQTHSFVGAATLAYELRRNWRAVVTGIASITPFAERRFEGMAKLIYQLTTRVREVKP